MEVQLAPCLGCCGLPLHPPASGMGQGTKLDGSRMLGVNLSRAVLDHASVKNCDLHDPSNATVAHLEVC